MLVMPASAIGMDAKWMTKSPSRTRPALYKMYLMSAMVWSVLTIFVYGMAYTPHTKLIWLSTRRFAVNM